MSSDSKKVKDIYTGKVADKYEYSMPPFFLSWKKKAFRDSSLKKGDKVLVYCCGTGLDFPYILNRIGSEGAIVGVDFSAEMLAQAALKIEKNHWKNIELIEADITEPIEKFRDKFDCGVCTLGLSIIPEFRLGYKNLLGSVKQNGELIIGDMQLASGWLSVFNPLTIFMARKFGGSHKGHENSLVIKDHMNQDLSKLHERVFFLGAYYYCIGQKM